MIYYALKCAVRKTVWKGAAERVPMR